MIILRKHQYHLIYFLTIELLMFYLLNFATDDAI